MTNDQAVGRAKLRYWSCDCWLRVENGSTGFGLCDRSGNAFGAREVLATPLHRMQCGGYVWIHDQIQQLKKRSKSAYQA